MADKSVNIRLSLRDGEVVKRALLSLGDDGQKALQRITNAAPQVSRGLKVVDASVRELRGSISLWAAEAGAGGRVLAAFGPAGLAAAAGIGATVFGLKALFDGAKNAVRAFDDLVDASDRLGIGVESLQALRFAASQLGVDAGVVDAALQKLGVTLGDLARGDNKAAQEAFNQLGVSAKDATGNIRTIEEVLPDLANGFARIRSETTRLSLGTDIFGKGNASVVTLLQGGAEALDEQIRKARELGAVIDETLVRRGAAAKDQLEGLAFVISAQFNAALVDMAPLLVKVSEAFAQLARAVGYYTDMSRPLEERQTQNITDKLAGLRKELAEQQQIMEQARQDKGMGVIGSWLGEGYEQLFYDAQRRVVELRLEINKLQNELDRRRTVNIKDKRDFGSFPRMTGEGSGLAVDADSVKRVDDAVKGFMTRMDAARKVYEEVKTAARRYEDELERLNELKKQGTIGETEYAKAVQNAKIELQQATKAERDGLLSFRTDSAAGAERALNQLRDKAMDDATAVEDAYIGMADTISSAFEDFAATGKFNLESLAEDFRRILAKMAVHYLQSAIFKILFPTEAAPGLLAPAAAAAPSIVGGPGAGLSSAFVPALAKAIAPAAYTSGPVPPIAGAGGTNQSAIWSFFKAKGLTDAQVAGVMGNIYAESGYSSNPPGYNDAGNAYGLFQHNGPRMQGLFSSAGTNSPSMQQQLDFAWSEIQKNPNYQGILKAGSVDEATRVFGKQFEAPADLEASINKRIAEANRVMAENAGKLADTTRQMTTSVDRSTSELSASLKGVADGTAKAGQEFGNKFPSGLSSILQGVGKSGGGMLDFFGTAFNASFGNLLGPMGRPHGYYAKGDVFSRPTVFPMAQGWGLMAEEGPEGVLPLRRNRRGDLGVILAGAGNDNRGGATTNIQVHNYADANVETRQSQRPDGSQNIEFVLNRKIDDRIGRQVPAINETGYGQAKRLKLR